MPGYVVVSQVPPDLVVAVEDLVGDARVGRGQRGDDPRKTRADDRHVHGLGNGHGARQCGLGELEATLLEQQRNELVVDVGAQRHRQQTTKKSGSSAGVAHRAAAHRAPSMTASTSASAVSGSVTPARSGGSGT